MCKYIGEVLLDRGRSYYRCLVSTIILWHDNTINYKTNIPLVKSGVREW